MNDDQKQGTDFERQFVRNQLVHVAKHAARIGMKPELFEALLITLSDELDFKDIMQISKEKVQ